MKDDLCPLIKASYGFMGEILNKIEISSEIKKYNEEDWLFRN